MIGVNCTDGRKYTITEYKVTRHLIHLTVSRFIRVKVT